jgi:hypothetical protein
MGSFRAGLAGTAVLLAACSAVGSSGPLASPAPDSSAPTTTTAATDAAVASDLPASCRAAPVLTPVSPTPTFPAGYQILDALPGALAQQYPTVYGGIMVAPATPGESAAVANSHFIVLETTHDPSLETEASVAYGPPLTVGFELSPRSWACLEKVQASVGADRRALRAAGIKLIGDGIRMPFVEADITACKPLSKRRAVQWFEQRWGGAVKLTTCAKVPVNSLLRS